MNQDEFMREISYFKRDVDMLFDQTIDMFSILIILGLISFSILIMFQFLCNSNLSSCTKHEIEKIKNHKLNVQNNTVPPIILTSPIITKDVNTLSMQKEKISTPKMKTYSKTMICPQCAGVKPVDGNCPYCEVG